MLKKKDICFIILLLIIIIIFIILNKKNEEAFYSEQPCPSPGPCPENDDNQETVNNQPSDSNNQESDSNNQESDNNNQPSDSNNQPSDSNNQASYSNNQASDSNNQPSDSNEGPSDKETTTNRLLVKLQNITIDTSNDTQKIFKEKLMTELFAAALSNKLKTVLGDKIKNKDLNNITNFEIEENKFIIKISQVNGLEIINNQQLLDSIKNNMLELFAKHIPNINEYEVLVTSGSLIITLKKKEEEATSTCEPDELQELEAFMKMFNNSGENIIQYEPDGVSGIFAPYIKLG